MAAKAAALMWPRTLWKVSDAAQMGFAFARLPASLARHAVSPGQGLSWRAQSRALF